MNVVKGADEIVHELLRAKTGPSPRGFDPDQLDVDFFPLTMGDPTPMYDVRWCGLIACVFGLD